MKLFPLLTLVLGLSAINKAHAQAVFYQPDTSVKVSAYGQPMTLAWAGGFNNPQFAICDLNHDNKKDLVIYESFSSLKTFINQGTAGSPDYRYAPEYAVNFPPIYSYLIMADYNCDGIDDLFDRGGYGYSVYKGYYNWEGRLCFTYYRDLYYYNLPSGPSNAYVEPGDRPAIVDVDGDGDLDFVSYYIAGGNLRYYKNLRVEQGLPCDSIRIALKDKCWGKVYQGFYRTHTLGYSCNNSGLKPGVGEKTTHSGNTPCLFDWDMDGDYDYLDGSVSYNEMTFLKNGRLEYGVVPDSMVSQDTMWQSGGKVITLPVWPTAYNVDIDQDGKKDLLISPNASSGSENYKCIWYYKNYSTTGTPDWRFKSDSFLTDKTIDLGTAAYPMLFDYNKDGKLDLIIGSDGYRQSTGNLTSRLSLYLNTSTPGNGSFALQSTNFLNLDALSMGGAAPATGDIDFDGLTDLVLGHTDGTISYFKNTAASESAQPNWTLVSATLTDMSGTPINVDGYAAPFIYDIDKDGKADLIIGNIYGYIQYYRNVATTPGSIKLELINSRLGNAKADPAQLLGNFSTPFIGKIDSSGSDYLLMGSNSGHIYQFTGFQSGDTTATYTLVNGAYSYIDTTYSIYTSPSAYYGIYGNLRTSVAVGDVDNSGKLSMIVGNIKGGVEFYKRKLYTASVPAVNNETHEVLVYPNPANNILNISWDKALGADIQVALFNMEGKQLYSGNISSAANHTTIAVDNLANGVYVCTVQSGAERHYSKFTIIR
jgi:hypothetical protein